MLIGVIFVLTAFFSGSHQQCFSNNDTTPKLLGDRYNNWIDSRHDFSVSLLQILNKEKNNENLIFSPSSVHEASLLLYLGAAGRTEASLAKALRKPYNIGKAHAWRFFQTERAMNYRNEIKKSYPLKVANKIFFSNTLKLRPCITANLWREAESIDYRTNAEWAKNYINSWVANKTEGEIKDAVSRVIPQTTAVLASAVYFKHNWETEFNRSYTKILPFRVNKKLSTPMKMMQAEDYFAYDYLDTIKARLLKLPYDGEKQAMIILLPDDDLDSTIASLNSNVIKLITNTDMLKVTGMIKVVFPTFKIENNFGMDSTLEKLGIGNTLTGSADFSRFTGRREVFFTGGSHKAVIKVDEEGTEAIAVTITTDTVSITGNRGEPFICDRPFAYFIYDYVTRKILFMGTFRKPPTFSVAD